MAQLPRPVSMNGRSQRKAAVPKNGTAFLYLCQSFGTSLQELSCTSIHQMMSTVMMHTLSSTGVSCRGDAIGAILIIVLLISYSYPKVRMSAGFLDSHVYVCRRSVLEVLQEKSRLDSLREEFMPWLCKPQYSSTKRRKYGSGG